MVSGGGSMRFRLVNMRDDVIMGFFTGGVYTGGVSSLRYC